MFLSDVLIIPEPDESILTPSANGGTITFKFNQPVFISTIGLMSIDAAGSTLTFHSRGQTPQSYGFRELGVNSVQRVIAEKSNVVKLEVTLVRPGAVTDIEVCQIC